MKWAVVIPSIRPEKFDQFVEAWRPLFSEHAVRVYVVWDLDEVPGDYPYTQSHRGQRPDFIPQGTDMCRSWGFYQAWRDENDYILSLDDDVLPSNTDIFKAYEYEFTRENLLSEYLNVGSLNSAEYPMRGVPYGGRWQEVVVQYGGWIGVPDLDAVTQLQDFSQHRNSIPARVILPVPKGIPMTTCAMNFAFKSEYTPLMWQLPLYEGRYNRFGDIWSGLIQKRVLDKMNKVMLLNQRANVIHKRASDPFTNLKREAPGMHLNESMWEKTDLLRGAIFEDPIIGAFKLSTLSMAYSIGAIDPEYRDHFIDARDKWLALFS